MSKPRMFFSPRGMPLVAWIDEDHAISVGKPILTVENYAKWYELFLIEVDGCLTSLHFGHLEQHTANGESAMCDHVPNPKSVAKMCEVRGYILDSQSFELMIGRWEIEYKETY